MSTHNICFLWRNKKNIYWIHSLTWSYVYCFHMPQRDLFHVMAYLFACVEVLRPSQLDRVMSSAVSLPNHTFTGLA